MFCVSFILLKGFYLCTLDLTVYVNVHAYNIFSALKDVDWDRFLWCFVFRSLPYSSVTLICPLNNSKHINLLSKKVFHP